MTPNLTTEEIRKTKKFSLVKADEILLWLNSHNNVTEWVVLDDLDLHNDLIRQHHVKTDQTIGLTPENIKQAVKILSGQLKSCFFRNGYGIKDREKGLGKTMIKEIIICFLDFE